MGGLAITGAALLAAGLIYYLLMRMAWGSQWALAALIFLVAGVPAWASAICSLMRAW